MIYNVSWQINLSLSFYITYTKDGIMKIFCLLSVHPGSDITMQGYLFYFVHAHVPYVNTNVCTGISCYKDDLCKRFQGSDFSW